MRFSLSSRAVDVSELLVGYGLILAVIWTTGTDQRALYWAALVWIAATSYLRRRQTRPLGFGLRQLWPSLWIVPAAFGLFMLGIWIARSVHTLHNLYGPLPVAEHVGEYAVWALMQEFILQVYVLLRLLRLGLGRVPAVAVASFMFACAHIPNPVLVPAVVIWAAIACSLYLRYRNLYAISVAHGLLGMCIALSVPNAINHHMRVGIGYLDYPSTHHLGLELNDR